jgi:hypothetical protein
VIPVLRHPGPAARAALAASVAFILAGGPAGAGPQPPRQPPLLVLVGPDGAERSVRASDFRFVYYERIFYDRHAPRSQEPSGRRLDIEDRRRACACILLEDLTRYKFKKLRQIEIVQTPGDAHPRLRLTERNGKVHEHPFASLAGTVDSLPPRFAATVDGVVREFPIAPENPAATGPGERLARVLLVTSPPPSSR